MALWGSGVRIPSAPPSFKARGQFFCIARKNTAALEALQSARKLVASLEARESNISRQDPLMAARRSVPYVDINLDHTDHDTLRK
jgi:hypothetical protein